MFSWVIFFVKAASALHKISEIVWSDDIHIFNILMLPCSLSCGFIGEESGPLWMNVSFALIHECAPCGLEP